MKCPLSLLATAFLSFTAVSCPIILAEKTTVYAQETKLDSTKAYLKRGLSYAKQGKHELAIADFNQAVRINPRDSRTFYNRGIFYSEQGNYKLARTDLEKAKQISLIQGDIANVERADSALKQLP